MICLFIKLFFFYLIVLFLTWKLTPREGVVCLLTELGLVQLLTWPSEDKFFILLPVFKICFRQLQVHVWHKRAQLIQDTSHLTSSEALPNSFLYLISNMLKLIPFCRWWWWPAGFPDLSTEDKSKVRRRHSPSLPDTR